MKKVILLVVLFASVFANAQVIGVYCDKTSIAPGERTSLRFVITGGSVQYFCYTDGQDYYLIDGFVGNTYIETVSPSCNTRYTLTCVSSGAIDTQHTEIYIRVSGNPMEVQTVFTLPGSCFDNDDPLPLLPYFWSNVPDYENLVNFEGPGVFGKYFYPNMAGSPGTKSIRAYLEYDGSIYGITREIRVIKNGTGIDEFNTDLSVSPNPTRGRITFSKPCTVEIYSMQGAAIMRTETQVKSIDISMLSSGVYVLRLFDGENIFVKRIVKN